MRGCGDERCGGRGDADARGGHREKRQDEMVEAFVAALLQDRETTVRDEARTALEQLDNPELVDRLQTLLDEGLLI